MNINTEADKKFDDIRPYRDNEVHAVLERIVNSGDFDKGLDVLMGKYLSFYSEDERGNLLSHFREKFLQFRTVSEFQYEVVVKYMLEPMISHTMDSMTSSGLENLSKDEAYLFLGNHRDITLDPALLNYNLMKNGLQSVEIGFGDNLLLNDFISNIIRLNKSFIVKRNLPLVKQLEASIHLSKYIFHTITQNRSVWLAHREGRAKDGNDVTNPAVLSMLFLSQRDGGLSFPEFIKKIRLVPVAVSYEYDPCDRLKALEIIKSRSGDQGEKSGTDDIVSMNQGITGYKGRVHYSITSPVSADGMGEKELAKVIDRTIQLAYHLWPTNYIAFDELNETSVYSSYYSLEEKGKFLERLKRYSPEMKSIVLEGYSTPVKNREIQLTQSV